MNIRQTLININTHYPLDSTDHIILSDLIDELSAIDIIDLATILNSLDPESDLFKTMTKLIILL